MSLKLINARQTTLSLGVGPADSIQATPPEPQSSAAPLCQHLNLTATLNQFIQPGVDRVGGREEQEERTGRVGKEGRRSGC